LPRGLFTAGVGWDDQVITLQTLNNDDDDAPTLMHSALASKI